MNSEVLSSGLYRLFVGGGGGSGSGSQTGSWATTEDDSGCENVSGGTLWITATHLATFLSRAENQTSRKELNKTKKKNDFL